MSRTVSKKKAVRKVAAKPLRAKVAERVDMRRVAKMPEPRPVSVVQAEIDAALVEAVKAQLQKRGVSIRAIVNWAFESYLLSHDRSTAKLLGVRRSA